MKALLTAVVVALGSALPLAGQDFPAGPVTIVVPSLPSCNTDVFTRHFAPYLEEKWGQNVIIDSRPGGGSMVRTAAVAQAAPDGQALLVTTSNFITAPAIQESLPFDSRDAFAPITNVGHVSYVLVTNGNTSVESLKNFVEQSKEAPKFAATAGLGANTHFAIEKLIAGSGTNVDVVHFKGGGPAIVSILSSETDFIARVTPLGWTSRDSTPEKFTAHIDEEQTTWNTLAEVQGIKK